MATFTSRSIPGFAPEDLLTYTTPVQITGHTVSNLTIARSPAGYAIFGWTHNDIFYCAISTDFEDVWRNDVIPDGDERIVYDNTSQSERVLVGSLWVDRGDLYCAIKTATTSVDSYVTGQSKVYIANSADNPTSWSLRGVIDSEGSAGGAIITVNQAAPPTILDSGRWVLPFPTYGLYATGFADHSGLSISDDRGITWTVVISNRSAPGSGGSTGPISTCVGLDPTTGYLYWVHYSGTGLNGATGYVSTNDGTSWSVLPNVVRETWQYNLDDNSTTLYVVGPGTGEYTWFDASNLQNDTGWTITSNTAIPSWQSPQFQTHVFLGYGAVAYVDTNRVARQPIQPCTLPRLLFIPYKDRFSHIGLDEEGLPNQPELVINAEHDFDNLKVVERWASEWMDRSNAAEKCFLFIPFKDHFVGKYDLTPSVMREISTLYFQNMKAIEWWALEVTQGGCACDAPSRCNLFIPYKNAMSHLEVDEEGVVDPSSLKAAAAMDFDNYKTIERWANSLARGECFTGGDPFPPYPDPPSTAARLAGQLMEVSTATPGSARLAGQLVEVSTAEAGSARLAGQLLEVAVVL